MSIAGLKEQLGVEANFAFVAPSVYSSHMEHLAATADEPRREAEETIEGSFPELVAAGSTPTASRSVTRTR